MTPELLSYMLRSDDPEARKAAARALEIRPDPIAVPALLVVMRDSNVGARRLAAKALYSLLDLRGQEVDRSLRTSISEAFQTALSDTSSAIRQTAISALTAIGDPSIVPTLLACWDDGNPGVRHALLSALSHFASEVPLRFCVNALSDPRPGNRFDAAQILEWIGDRAAVPDLLIARHDEDRRVRRRVMHTLIALGEGSAELVADCVADLADPNPLLAVDAAKELGLIGNPVAVPDLVSTLASFHPLVVRLAAAKALGAIADHAAVPALVSVLKDPDGLVRATAAKALGDIGDPIGLAPLEDLVSDHATYSEPGLHQPGPSPQVSTAATRASAKIKSAQALRTIHFFAYYPREIAPNAWQAAHVYVFGLDAAELVAADAQALLSQLITEYRINAETVWLMNARDKTTIRVVPRLDGFEFNPAYQLIEFCEPWHRLDFRLRASEKYLRQASNGTVSIMVNGAIVGDIPMSIYVHAELPTSRHSTPQSHDDMTRLYKPYQSIFCSYSHRDEPVAKRLERVYRALGMSYLRDKASLRSGENWSEEILTMIDRADVFQLLWSKNAADSTAVEKEWRRACGLRRQAERFIRPVYWTEPMPHPPAELAHLHFAFEPEL